MRSQILREIISSNEKCLIVPHQSPDGDCLGSSYTLSNFLTKHGNVNFIVMDDLLPSNLAFLKKDNMITSEEVRDTFKYGIILDTSSLDRVGTTEAVIKQCEKLIVIDHHKTNVFFGDENIVEMVSSVGELLYLMYQDVDYKIDQEDAIGLYTSLVTDTGEFRYSNTSAQTLKVAAEIFDTGFDFERISRLIFSNQELNKVVLKSRSLSDIQLYGNGQIAVTKVTQAMLKELSCEMYHSDGIVEAGRDIAGVEVSVLLKEINDNQVKVSLRSKEHVDVSVISLLYKGGGHARAAGLTVHLPLDEVEKVIVKEIEKRL